MTTDATCPICTISAAASMPLGGRWRLRRHPDPSPVAGWAILDLARHVATLDELTGEESEELGRLLVEVSAAVREATGCARVYLLSFAEAARHVHLHLVPRHEREEETRGWSVADHYRAVAAGTRSPADPARCAAAFAEIARRLPATRSRGSGG